MEIQEVSSKGHRRVERDRDVREDSWPQEMVWNRCGPGKIIWRRYLGWTRIVDNVRNDAEGREDEKVEVRETGL